MKKNKKIILGLSLKFILANIAYSSDIVILSNTDIPKDPNILITLQNLDSAYDFKAIKTINLSNGIIRHKLMQYYNNIPVWDTAIVSNKKHIQEVNLDDYITGRYLINIEQDLNSITPTLSTTQAIEIVKNIYQILDQNELKNLNINLIINKFEDNKARLVYLINFFNDTNFASRPFIMLDANTGELLKQWEGLTSADYAKAIGPGGNKKTGKYAYGTDYPNLIVSQQGNTCSMSSDNVSTYNMKHQKSGEVLHTFNCFENSFKEINGAYSPINDAHYFGNTVYQMYKEWFNASPLTFKLKMRVHYDNNYDNAFWDGSQMTFGDGSSRFYPLVSLDVVAHEISHGFTEQNSNLVYEGQSGGINEAFSDIAGEATEYFMHSNKPENQRVDWLVGGTIMKNAGALRYFEDPTKDGISIGHAKDYSSSLDVHQSSGVFNRAYYLLANTNGWNMKKAFEVFVLANQVYWTQSTNFNDGACGVYKAAKDLNYNDADVTNAFKTVGIQTCSNTPDPDPNPDPTPTPSDSIELKNWIPYYYVTGNSRSNGLFYIDVTANNAYGLSIYNFGGNDIPVMKVAYNRIPSGNDYDCISDSRNINRKCDFTKPKQGRYYITINSTSSNSYITMFSGFY